MAQLYSIAINCVLVTLLLQCLSTSGGQPRQASDQSAFNWAHRSRRSAVRGNNRHYPYGIVPFSFSTTLSITQRGIIRRAMEHYQDLTCLRFVPRISRDGQWAKDLYNLEHDGYMDFVHNEACFSGLGNNNGRTLISCCGRERCIREIGHALGLIYEHQSPNRDGIIRINDNIIGASDQKARYIKNLPSDVLGNSPFDISSPMLSELGDSNARVELLTPDVSREKKDFYMFQDIVAAHQCRENNCSSFHTDCSNDGYVTLVYGSCQCRCPEGLNPHTGCRTTLSQDRAEDSCGGVFELTEDNPTVTFAKHQNLTAECSWLIKAPVGDTLKLDFNQFNISRRNGECEDEIEIRHMRIGQGGRMFCGTNGPAKIKSYFNHVMVTFLPPRTPRPLSYFNATVKLVSARTLCYNPRDRGYTYDGSVNYTRDYTPCLEWWKTAHCPHNPYSSPKINMNNNFCRNPGDGLAPWCYVTARLCERKYCDVCMLDTPTDKKRDCASTIKWYQHCHHNRHETLRTCAKTCANELSSVQPSALTVECLPPPQMSDSDQVDKLDQTRFAVGDSVTFKCRHVNSLFRTELTKYCLTTGHWTLGNTSCLPCHLNKGYVLHDGSCYKVNIQRRTANNHQRNCELDGGQLANVKNVAEQEFITDLAFSKGATELYIGPNDMYREGTFRYRDYLPITWSNWDSQNRNHRHKDCVHTTPHNTWLVVRCRRRLQAVCKTPMLRHRRLGLADCSDSRGDCQELLDKDERMCYRAGGSFGVSQCPRTCGKCI